MPRSSAVKEPELRTKSDAVLAEETSRALAACIRADNPMQLRIGGGRRGPAHTVKLPADAVRLLVRILDEMAQGNAVTVVPVRAEITTQQAADMLNISRPSLIQILDEGGLPYRLVGSHRRLRLEDVVAHKRKVEAARRRALEQLSAYDQEIGI